MSNLSMKSSALARRIRNKIKLPLPIFRVLHRSDPQFECPICSYEGPFFAVYSFAGNRSHAECPSCGSLERHRLQFLVIQRLISECGSARDKLRVLHFAPEKCFSPLFAGVSQYDTADLFAPGVKFRCDIRRMQFADASYDFFLASHVLEHVQEDMQAIAEIRRILRANGIAVLPVPIVCDKTIEYGAPNRNEGDHVRAPGVDYFDRYRSHFTSVEVFTSDLFPRKHQVYVYEDRSIWPTPECPYRRPMSGEKHLDFVPVCRV